MEVSMKDEKSVLALCARTKVPLEEIGQAMFRLYGLIFECMGKNGIEPAGAPFTLYYGEEEVMTEFDMEACVPISEDITCEGEVECKTIEGGTMAGTIYKGPYEGLKNIYDELMKWVSENAYVPTGPAKEVYLVGVNDTENPSEFVTEILFPVRRV